MDSLVTQIWYRAFGAEEIYQAKEWYAIASGGNGRKGQYTGECMEWEKRKVEERVLMVEASDQNGRQMLQRVAGIII
jgi:hypothetical protein